MFQSSPATQSWVRSTSGYLCVQPAASLISKCTHTKKLIKASFILHFDLLCVGVTTFSECLAPSLPFFSHPFFLVDYHQPPLITQVVLISTCWYRWLCHIWWHCGTQRVHWIVDWFDDIRDLGWNALHFLGCLKAVTLLMVISLQCTSTAYSQCRKTCSTSILTAH